MDGKLISNSTPHAEGIGTNVARFGFIGVGSNASEFNGATSPTYFLNGNIFEIIIIEGKLSTDKQAKINYYLSKKWNLESSVDSDDDGYTDANDPNPLTITNLPDLISTGTIGMTTDTIRTPLTLTGDHIPAGLTFEITNQPTIGSAQIIVDATSNSGYSLQYRAPTITRNSRLNKVDINVKTMNEYGVVKSNTIIPIYFYLFEINLDRTMFIPPGFARLDQTSIQENDIIWNFNNISFNDIGNNQNDTIAEEIGNIPNDVNNIGDNLPISAFNSITNSDQLGNYPILYKIESNDYFDINPTSGEVFVKDTSFTEIDSLELMVQATATTNEGIEGVYTFINIRSGFVDIGFDDDFIGTDGQLDFERISFDIPVLEDEETYGVNFRDDQFSNFEGPIPINENFKNKFFNEKAKATFDNLDINFTTDISVSELDLTGTSESTLDGELKSKKLKLGGAYNDDIKWSMNNPNAFLKVDDECTFGTGVTFEIAQGTMETPIFNMAQSTTNGEPQSLL